MGQSCWGISPWAPAPAGTLPKTRDSAQVFFFLFSPSSKPASEVINEYSRKVDFLKGMLQAEKLVSRGALFPRPVSRSSAQDPRPLVTPFPSSADLLLREGTGQPVSGPWPCANHSQGEGPRHQDGAPAVPRAVHQRNAERAARHGRALSLGPGHPLVRDRRLVPVRGRNSKCWQVQGPQGAQQPAPWARSRLPNRRA